MDVFDQFAEGWSRAYASDASDRACRRTVKQMYRSGVRYDLIARAAGLDWPVRCWPNGNVYSPEQALEVHWPKRGAPRIDESAAGRFGNPWLFTPDSADNGGGETAFILPTGREVMAYVVELWEAQTSPDARESAQVQRLKKFMNFIGEGMEPPGPFLHDIRRVNTKADFFRVCAAFLDHDRPMRLEPATEMVAEMATADGTGR